MNQVLNVGRITGAAGICIAMKHNLREIQAERGANTNIDPSRMGLNRVLAGPASAKAVAKLARDLMEAAGVGKLRKVRVDAVRAIEILISLPPSSPIDEQAFFAEAVHWVESFFDGPLLSAVVHNDEAAPHLHALVLPLREGRMVGADMIGDLTRLRIMHADFHEKVSSRYGLARSPAKRRLNVVERREIAERIVCALRGDLRALDRPDVRGGLLTLIASDPEPLAMALDVALPTKPPRKQSFVKIMTAPTKPHGKVIRSAQQKPIGFVPEVRPRTNARTLCSVGFGAPATVESGVSVSDGELCEQTMWDLTVAESGAPLCRKPAA